MGPRTRSLSALPLALLLASCQGSPAASLRGDARTAAEARGRADALLERVFLPTAVGTGEQPPPADDGTLGNVVRTQRSYVALGRAATIIAGLKTRPPSGLQNAISAVELSTSTVELTPAGRGNSGLQTVQVAATDVGSGRVAIEVRAQVGWLTARTPVETIPWGGTAARLAIGFGDEPDEALRHLRVLTGEQLARIAGALNALPVTAPGEYAYCPDPDIALSRLTVSYGGHRVQFAIQVGGCDQVSVSVDGVDQPLLGSDRPVVVQLAAVLGIPIPLG